MPRTPASADEVHATITAFNDGLNPDDVNRVIAALPLVADEHRQHVMLIDDLDAITFADPLLAPHEQRRGRCYEIAGLWVMEHYLHLTNVELTQLSIQLHHGSIQGGPLPRIGHAWVSFRNPEHSGERWAYEPVAGIFMPAGMWTDWANAVAARTYDHRLAIRHLQRHQQYGPWHARPFGLDDCPHGHEPHGLPCQNGRPVNDDGDCDDPTCQNCSLDKLCHHGCTHRTLKDN